MTFKQITLSHTTTVGTFVIKSLPGTSKEKFLDTLRRSLNTATPTNPQRDTNPISQELLIDETQADTHICLWSLRFNGIHAPDRVRTKCQVIYEGVHETIENVGAGVSFRLETLEGAWEVV